jgi:Mrp family chromosome partitioning ATPase
LDTSLKSVIVLMILSLKGGVGKSSISCSLAYYLSEVLKIPTALWDLDVTNPSAPKILGISGRDVQVTKESIIPVSYSENLKVLSLDFFLPSSDQPIIFKGTMKASVIQQFLKTVDFGNAKYLILDTPPTTSEELLTILDLFERDRVHVVFVTEDSAVSNNSVSKSIRFLKEKGYPIKGVLCNRSTAICPRCHHWFSLFYVGKRSVADIAKEYGIPYLGDVPVGENMKSPILTSDHFITVAKRILESESVQYKPKFGKIGALDKLMLAMSLRKGLKKMEAEK